jgi:hypothetical protein
VQRMPVRLRQLSRFKNKALSDKPARSADTQSFLGGLALTLWDYEDVNVYTGRFLFQWSLLGFGLCKIHV